MSKKKFVFYICLYYIVFSIEYLLLKEIQMLDDINSIIILGIPLIVCIFANYIIKIFETKNEMIVKKISKKYQKIDELNHKYNFNDLGKINRIIREKEYSHKAFDRARANSIL